MKLEDAKRRSVAQLLFYCARRVDERARERLSAQTGVNIRAAHTALFPHVSVDGVRLTGLAQRMGVTKQSVAPLVDELVAAGLLEKVPDPDDGRARLIRFGGGEAGLRAGLSSLVALEAGLIDAIGEGPWTALHDGLLALEQVLSEDDMKRRV